jgi:hypothetical protein
MKDKHDPRDFEQFVKLNDDGTVAAVTMIAVGSEERQDDAVLLRVDHLGDIALDDVKVDPKLVTAIKDKRTALNAAALAHAQAFADHATAVRTTLDAFAAEAVKPRG